mmetsp:Transcript_49310/g.81869  ORF Transcript_49310/g.81869 Transcript_49310/m.81869 type:complete len:363 (+) Transcript_49310:72-1160(+)|eukprot:CAMPEP_0119306204 /NCGR_PEP_ID=MMETSP1333-20130426/7010_1 /TAXON_ID=418940 /ORGANISM="Scyphosphaera apsteinii, Strain RCC1455" /LENGTH=362 /DNA_ID=CAMNT_0007309449 /DNA_START=76 /DNA_END=1164 /DNA_ORIENTATION=-
MCDVCLWWQSPVVIGGEEGSGTRGAVEILRGLGLYILRCDANSAHDSGCIQATLKWQAAASAYVRLKAEDVLTCDRSQSQTISATMEPQRARRALDEVPIKARRPWAWGWKMPHSMWTLPALRAIFPCLRYVHVLRDPRDLAADAVAHLGMRANHLRALSFAYGCPNNKCTTHRNAAIFMCNRTVAHLQPRSARPVHAKRCRQLVLALPPYIPIGASHTGGTTSAFYMQVARSLPLRRAVQCLVLMEWVGNLHCTAWAKKFLQPELGFTMYQSEVAVNHSTPLASALRARLRCVISSKCTHGVGNGRRLSYGEWQWRIERKALEQLGNCGGWQSAFEVLSKQTGFLRNHARIQDLETFDFFR